MVEINSEVDRICKEEYDSSNNGEYYYVENTTSKEVKANILSKMKPEYAKPKILDSVVFIMDIDGKVFINKI